jgi:hypothetical protein
MEATVAISPCHPQTSVASFRLAPLRHIEAIVAKSGRGTLSQVCLACGLAPHRGNRCKSDRALEGGPTYTAFERVKVKQLSGRKWTFLAGGLGFEPRFLESKSNVLPLDDPPATGRKYTERSSTFEFGKGRAVCQPRVRNQSL